MTFIPQEARDAELIAERIVVHLQHGNSAVILTTIKVLLYLMNYMADRKRIEYICKKMGPPLGSCHISWSISRIALRLLSLQNLVTMLSSGPEVQYVALRNILLIIQRRPAVLKNDVKVFFCKYNDPIYVKLAKLEIMYRLARDENVNEVLTELQEYVLMNFFIFIVKLNPSVTGTPQRLTSTLYAKPSALLGDWRSKSTQLRTGV